MQFVPEELLRPQGPGGLPVCRSSRTALYFDVQEVQRQHEALQEAGNAVSQREGQLQVVQAEVSRLQVSEFSCCVAACGKM